ncbi:hypothetical protein Patl1_32493 [Pistacia atlantica]|uniref:Uncharacterized protein n=1 Tax=Pistacia atlantica TaxID=434234 RepID=A0ACC1API1_9ROSI|nr:hypothetical protein Patl1_32493 [Pistacia atlantica]
MVVPDPKTISQGEVESPLQSDQQHKNHQLSSLGRQSSIYSLTLDEFQHTLCERGKNFGSMNMDEFLTSIWNAEENQAINSTINNNNINNNVINNQKQLSLIEASSHKGIAKQPSLPRQGSLTLPAPLCRKTVEEVWSEIHRGQHGQQHNNNNNNSNVQNPEAASRQATFGEMTLEDFLIKAGIVRETTSQHAHQQQQHFELYQTNNSPVMSPASFGARPLMGMNAISGGGSNSGTVGPSYQPMTTGRGVMAESAVYNGNEKRNGGYPAVAQLQQPPPQQGVCYGGRGGGFAMGQAIGAVSPASSEVCANQMDSSGSQFGMEMSGLRVKKRIIDGPVEKVVERRQRRMIKNRESAARSRARKQAYTVELEAELNQLKEENAHLKQALADLERKRKQQYLEELKQKAYTKAQKAKEKLRIMRRNLSCPL